MLSDARTDWLALQVIYIKYDTTREDGPHLNQERVKLIKKIREIFQSSSERLTQQAVELGHLEMPSMADELALLYDVLPKNMFRKV
jgi:uncharacterized protein (DUF924 family)